MFQMIFLTMAFKFYMFSFSHSYQNSWKELATSAHSEKQIGMYDFYLYFILD